MEISYEEVRIEVWGWKRRKAASPISRAVSN